MVLARPTTRDEKDERLEYRAWQPRGVIEAVSLWCRQARVRVWPGRCRGTASGGLRKLRRARVGDSHFLQASCAARSRRRRWKFCIPVAADWTCTRRALLPVCFGLEGKGRCGRRSAQAEMLFLCTSNPQQQGYKTSIVVSLTALRRTLAKNENLLRVLSATSGGHHLLCLYSVRAILVRGLVGTRVRRPRSHRAVAKHDTPISRPFHPSLWAWQGP